MDFDFLHAVRLFLAGGKRKGAVGLCPGTAADGERVAADEPARADQKAGRQGNLPLRGASGKGKFCHGSRDASGEGSAAFAGTDGLVFSDFCWKGYIRKASAVLAGACKDAGSSLYPFRIRSVVSIRILYEPGMPAGKSMTEVKGMDIVSAILVLGIIGCFVAAVISERKK